MFRKRAPDHQAQYLYYLYSIYIIFTQYLHTVIYTVYIYLASKQYLQSIMHNIYIQYSIYTVCIFAVSVHAVYSIYTVSTQFTWSLDPRCICRACDQDQTRCSRNPPDWGTSFAAPPEGPPPLRLYCCRLKYGKSLSNPYYRLKYIGCKDIWLK